MKDFNIEDYKNPTLAAAFLEHDKRVKDMLEVREKWLKADKPMVVDEDVLKCDDELKDGDIEGTFDTIYGSITITSDALHIESIDRMWRPSRWRRWWWWLKWHLWGKRHIDVYAVDREPWTEEE